MHNILKPRTLPLVRPRWILWSALLWMLLAISPNTWAGPYQCTFQTGEIVETRFPCEPSMVARFTKRLIDLYPDVQQINTSPDYMMGLYTFAMSSCTGQFASMTPEEIGANGEPFFPKDMLAAMVTAGREEMCPGPR